MKFRVIIVEDDPMVARINSQYVQKNPELELVGQFADGQKALSFLEVNPVDLIILDLYMPVMDGRTFLKKLRSKNLITDVIMVTAASESSQIESLLQYGIFDYLVKPFEYSRFASSLEKYLAKKSVLNQNTTLTQKQLDELLLRKIGVEKESFPIKGLQHKTLETLRLYLREHEGEELTSETIADQIGLSRVTVRRYMNYLIELKEVDSTIDYNTGGRPSIIYTYNG